MSFPANKKYNFVVCTIQVEDTGCGADDYDESIFDELIENHVAYIHAGREQGSHKHWQCYFEAPSQWLGSKWKKFFPGSHFEVAKGTAEQCIDYQSKEDNEPFTHGVWRNKGHGGKRPRTDLIEFVKAVRTGASDAELFEKHATEMIHYRNAASDIRSAFAQKQSSFPEVWLLWGETSMGKSHMANEDGAEMLDYSKEALQNYSGTNPVVCFDEFNHEALPMRLMLKLVDKYEVTVNVKFGKANWNPRRILITSNEDPDTWWIGRCTPEQRDAFYRKLKDGGGGVKHLTIPYVEGSGDVRALPLPLYPRVAPPTSPIGSEHSGSDSEDEGELI